MSADAAFPDPQAFMTHYTNTLLTSLNHNNAGTTTSNAMTHNLHQYLSNDNQNVLQFHLEGFQYPLKVKFPEFRLPVCEKCKKNYKTRHMCRQHNGHMDLPWSPVYICLYFDESCMDHTTGKLITDVPFQVRSSAWQPYCIQKDQVATYFDSKTPICAACKKKNYTRTFCRDRHKHRSLPWSTVYVTLSVMEGMVPTPTTTSTEEASGTAADANVPNGTNVVDDVPSNGTTDPATLAALSASYLTSTTEGTNSAATANENADVTGIAPGTSITLLDDLSHLEDSNRVVLLKLSAKESVLQFVELDESELNSFGVGGYTAPNARSAAVVGSTNPYLNFTGNYMGASYPNPIQMAQFFAAFSSPNSTDENGTPTDNSNNPEDLNAMQQQYQQYMSWQAQMWYHQQTQMTNTATTANPTSNAEGTTNDNDNLIKQEDDVTEADEVLQEMKRTKRV